MRVLWVLLLMTSYSYAAEKVELVAGGLKEPFGMGFLGKDLMLTDFGGHRIILISPDGKTSVLAGSGKVGNADGTGEAASLNAPHNLALMPNGMTYIADTMNHRLRLLDPKTKALSTLGGSDKGFAGDEGPVAKAKFDQLYHVALDAKNEHLLICDLGNRRIRSVDLKTNIITTVAGNGKRGVPKDGENAVSEPLVDPRAMEIDAKGRLWIVERGGHALRVVENGKIKTVIGTGKAGLSADNVLPKEAMMNGPKNLFITKEGTVLIADTENHCIREYNPEANTFKRLIGTGKKGKGEVGGLPLETALNRPHAVTVDAAGFIYVADSDNGRVIRFKK